MLRNVNAGLIAFTDPVPHIVSGSYSKLPTNVSQNFEWLEESLHELKE